MTAEDSDICGRKLVSAAFLREKEKITLRYVLLVT